MTVQEYALRQLHWLIQKDPWVQEIFLAAGLTLDGMAERILGIYNSENFEQLQLAQIRYYERCLGLMGDETKTLEDRRAAIQAAWNIAKKPTLATLQTVCDSWKEGGALVDGRLGGITIRFIGEFGIPANEDDLKRAIEQTIPAHLSVEYVYRYLLIKEVHGVMTLSKLAETPLNQFAGGA